MFSRYGVALCGVIDKRNLNFPAIGKGAQVKAEELFISLNTTTADSSSTNRKRSVIIVIVLLFGLALFLFSFFTYYRRRKRRNQVRKKQINLAALRIAERQQNLRYVDLVRKPDYWELERRNLIICDDKKLGAGAFGAVYLGKLIGLSGEQARGSNTRNINLMRLNADNASVAVKMLPGPQN